MHYYEFIVQLSWPVRTAVGAPSAVCRHACIAGGMRGLMEECVACALRACFLNFFLLSLLAKLSFAAYKFYLRMWFSAVSFLSVLSHCLSALASLYYINCLKVMVGW
jgi:hypothetical protein